MKVELGNYVDLVNEKSKISEARRENYVSTENLLPDRKGIVFPAKSLPNSKFVQSFKKGDVLVSNIRPYFKKIWHANIDGCRSGDVLDFRTNNKKLLQDYLYVLLQTDTFFKYVTTTSKGTKMPRGDKNAIKQFKIELPNLDVQKNIAYKIKVIEAKIALNEEINDNLDILMTSMFENIFQNLTDQNFSTLSEIANFKNGLAMQKYRPQKQEDSLPVLKIRELNQGFTDKSSDRCSSDIDNKVIINAGDIVFSWSGTLLLKIWSGKKAGLNQHLFKVTSNRFPAWFIYGWTNHYMKKFKSIASYKATTMGHIKRSDLSSSKVIVPDNENLATLNKLFNPLFKKRIQVTKENAALLDLRRELLNHFLN